VVEGPGVAPEDSGLQGDHQIGRHPVLGGQPQDPVDRAGVAVLAPDLERQPVGPGERGEALLHCLDLVDRSAHQARQHRGVVEHLVRSVGVQLERVQHEIDPVLVPAVRNRLPQAMIGHIAGRADHVRPHVDP